MVVTESEARRVAGWVMVTDAVEVQEWASVTVTVYDPAVKPVALELVCPSLHAYVYGVVPPVAEAEALPSERP